MTILSIFPGGVMPALLGRESPSVKKRSLSTDQFATVFRSVAIGSGIVTSTEAWRSSPWVRPAIEAEAGALASRTFKVYKGKQEQSTHWLLDLIAKPNRDMRLSQYDLLYQTFAIKFFFGEAFWILDFGDGGHGRTHQKSKKPVAIWVYHPLAMSLAYDKATGREFLGWVVQWETDRFFIDKLDVIQFRNYDPTKHEPRKPSRGTSQFSPKMLAISSDIAASLYNLDFFSRGVAPSIVFISKEDIDPNSKEKLIAKMKAEHGGKNGEPFVLEGGEWSVQQLKANQKDADFIGGKESNRSEIIGGIIPPVVVGKDDASYANAEIQTKIWWTYRLKPEIRSWCSSLDVSLLDDEPNSWTDLSTKDIPELQADERERFKMAVTARENGMPWRVAAKLFDLDIDRFPGDDVAFIAFSETPFDNAPAPDSNAPPDPNADPNAQPKPNDPNMQPKPADANAAPVATSGVQAAAQKVALNGAQVTSATAIVAAVAAGEIPLDAGLGQLQVLFSLTVEEAKLVMGSAGNPDIETTPNPKPASDNPQPPLPQPGDLINVQQPPPPPSQDQQPRFAPDTIIRVIDPATRTTPTDDVLGFIAQIVLGDNEKLKTKARSYHLQAIETGQRQIGKLLGIDTLVGIDDPRVTAFLETRGNLIVSVNETTAEQINKDVQRLMDEGATPETIGDAIRDRYNLRDKQAARIARQEVGSGLNGGRFIEMEQEGVQRREWLSSRDDRVRESHVEVDGEVVAMDESYSNGLRYPQDPNGDASEVINCFPGETSVHARSIERAYRAIYSGQLVTIETSLGNKLTGTPNHPVLTERGFVALGTLVKGDRVISRSSAERMTGCDPDVERTPSRIDEVFHALARSSPTQRVSAGDVDFYGDRPDGEVEIVTTDGQLWGRDEISVDQPLSENILSGPDLGSGGLFRDGLPSLDGVGNTLTSDAVVSRSGKGEPLSGSESLHSDTVSSAAVTDLDARGDQSRTDSASSDAESASDSKLGFLGQVPADDLGVVNIVPPVVASDVHAALSQQSEGGRRADAEVFDDLRDALACDVALDEVVNVSTRDWSGHVYTLQTESGMYLAGNIVARNCRCIELPVVGDAERSVAVKSRIGDRVAYWRAATKNVRSIENSFTNALQTMFNAQRGRVLKSLAARGVAK